MNFLEKALATLAPSAAARRSRARFELQRMETAQLIARKYDGAARSPKGGEWHVVNTSATSEVTSAASMLRARARDLVRNNPHANRIVQAWVSEAIGTGISLVANTGNVDLDKKVNALWDAFKRECDAETGLDFDSLQALCLRSVIEGGEVLVRFRPRRVEDGLTVPLQLQVLEPDFLDESANYTGANKDQVIAGIQFGPVGQRVGYHLYSTHPGDTQRALADVGSKLVPASEVLHVYKVDRAGQVRGASWFAPVMTLMRDLKEYREALLIKKKIEACFSAIVVKTDAVADFQATTNSLAPTSVSQGGHRIEHLSPGMIEYLSPGEDIRFAQPSSTAGDDVYIKTHEHAIAAGMGLPYMLVTGDLSQATFASQRAGIIAFRRQVAQLQWHMLTPMLLLPVWKRFIESAQLANKLPANVSIPCKVVPPRHEWIDPQADIQAEILAVRAGLKTPSDAVLGMGEEPTQHFEKYAADIAQIDLLKLQLSIDARQPYSSDTATSGGVQDKKANK